MSEANREWIHDPLTGRRYPPILGGDDPVEGEVEETPAPVTGISSDEFKQFTAQQGETNRLLLDTVNGLKAIIGSISRPPETTRRAPQTQAELDAAVVTGDKAGEAVTRAIDERIAPLRQENQQLKEVLARSARTEAVALRDEAGNLLMPHYSRFKKEIDEHVAQFPVEMRMEPRVWVETYRNITGRNTDALIQEAVDKALREAGGVVDESGSGGRVVPIRRVAGEVPPTRGGRQAAATGPVPTVEELMGPAAAEALKSVGKSPDSYAQSLGYENWRAYATLVKQQREEA